MDTKGLSIEERDLLNEALLNYNEYLRLLARMPDSVEVRSSIRAKIDKVSSLGVKLV
jgi:hypothetical protein